MNKITKIGLTALAGSLVAVSARRKDKLIELGSLNDNIISLNDSLHVLQDNILVKEAKIEKLKNDYAKKIDNINNFTSNDVTKYFTNRYE